MHPTGMQSCYSFCLDYQLYAKLWRIHTKIYGVDSLQVPLEVLCTVVHLIA